MWLSSLYSQFRQMSLRPKQVAIYEACVIGLVSGLAAVLLKQGTSWLGGWRISVASEPGQIWLLPLIGLMGGMVAGFLVEQISPEARGSGIPQVKAALANYPIVLNLRVALVKLVSVILVMGSGLSLGRQGPTVHIGVALAAQFNQWIPTSPEYRRQLLAAGAAAGLAAGFNAPIAGVLFVVEELLHDFSGLTLGTAILASFIGAVVSRLLGDQGLSLNSSITEASITNVSLQDVPFLALLGLLAGIFGALFSRSVFTSFSINHKLLQIPFPWKVGAAGLLTGLVMMVLPQTFWDNTGLPRFLREGELGWHFALLAFVVKFVLTVLACGSGAPGGIFAPALILGSALGYLVGAIAQYLQVLVGIPLGVPPEIGSTGLYALAGMGAFFSAVTKGPITAIVIVFEMTTDFNLVLPLMISSVIASLTADLLFTGSLYSRLLNLKGIHLEEMPDSPGSQLTTLTAATLMQRRVETLSSTMSLNEAVQAFSRSHHRGFPVVDNGRLVGIVTQSDLSDSSRLQGDRSMATLASIMTPQPVTVKAHDPLTHVLYLLNRFKISRLPVVEGQKLVGIITRADIIRAESDQLSGDMRRIGPQPEPSYVVYQTQAPAIGQGRLLVLLHNPQTTEVLLHIAGAIARSRNYELECLQIITVSRSQSPDVTPVRTTYARRLLKRAEQFGRSHNIPVHTQIRVAHDVAQAVLEAIKQRHIDLAVMGWRGKKVSPGRVFGDVVDTLIRQAPCEVMVVKRGEHQSFDQWLLPIAGGPNAKEALDLLPALVKLGESPEVKVCQVFGSIDDMTGATPLQDAVEHLSSALSCPVLSRPVWSSTIAESVITLAWKEESDVILIGASREGLLQQAIKGNIPEAIARRSTCTVLLYRGSLDDKTKT